MVINKKRQIKNHAKLTSYTVVPKFGRRNNVIVNIMIMCQAMKNTIYIFWPKMLNL